MTSNEKTYFDAAYNLKNSNETKEHYANWAQTYDQEIGIDKAYMQPSRCADALSTVLEEKSAKILDIGCGTGLSGTALVEVGYSEIDGCDISPEMLVQAEKCGAYKTLFEANLNQPPIAATYQAYDAAVAVGVFSFGHVLPDAIDEILRVIKPNGFLVIGLNDHYYDLGEFPAKLGTLEKVGTLKIADKQHGAHLANVDGSTGWVFTLQKC